MKKVLFVLLVIGVLMLGNVFAAEEIDKDSPEDIEFQNEPNNNPIPLSGEGGGSGSGGVPG
jgi:hypothetical protein